MALVVDRIFEDLREKSQDVSAQPFNRVEAQEGGPLRPEVAARPENMPVARISSLSFEEKEEVTNLDEKWPKDLDGPRGRLPLR